ncbi:MAG: chorismate mutase [Eubacteriaceae bacterium]|nr:chorismate mutase [Eubacteriaceae bacterium]
MNEIDRIRKKIDETDEKIASLLNERMKLSEAVGRAKKGDSVSVRNREREEQVISRAASAADGRFSYYVSGIYENIIAFSRLYQHEMGFVRGLVGERISASCSPYIHSLFGDGSYRLAQMDADDFPAFMKHRVFEGINVTMPFKRTAMALCDHVSETALGCGCVNTVVNRDGSLWGYNTDAFGFGHTLERYGIDVAGKRCLILGSGASCGTVRYVLEKRGAKDVTVISRSGGEDYCDPKRYSYAQVIVNTTPVGMSPDCDSALIDPGKFAECEALVDIVYTPMSTELVLRARDAGIRAVGGMDMLISQAWASHELFCDREPSGDVPGDILSVAMRYPMNIVLVGMPGCGKSTVGSRLARDLGMDFVDTDRHIEKRTGRSPEELIRRYGEKYFRGVEARSILEVSSLRHTVIACGGGAVLSAENRRALRRNGVVVYLQRDLESLCTRGRPLSASREGLEKLYEQRKGIYEECCDIMHPNAAGLEESVSGLRTELDDLFAKMFREG